MTEKNHCTLFDILTKEKGTDKLINTLTSNCLSSLITNPLSHRTFIQSLLLRYSYSSCRILKL